MRSSLARLLAELDAAPEVDVSLSGFDDDEVAKLLKSLDAQDKRERIEHFDPDSALERGTGQPCRPTRRPVGASAITGFYAAIRPTCTPWGACLRASGPRSWLPIRPTSWTTPAETTPPAGRIAAIPTATRTGTSTTTRSHRWIF